MSKQEFEQSNIYYEWNYKDYSEYILEKYLNLKWFNYISKDFCFLISSNAFMY